jgi:hypothetical protein
MKVRFTDVGEFLEELRRAVELRQVEQGILRHTQELVETEHMTRLDVVAGDIETQWSAAPDHVIHRRLIELRVSCGLYRGANDRATKHAQARANALQAKLDAAAEALRLEVRAGLFEP